MTDAHDIAQEQPADLPKERERIHYRRRGDDTWHTGAVTCVWVYDGEPIIDVDGISLTVSFGDEWRSIVHEQAEATGVVCAAIGGSKRAPIIVTDAMVEAACASWFENPHWAMAMDARGMTTQFIENRRGDMRAALTAALAVRDDGWRPMVSAPKGGTRILAVIRSDLRKTRPGRDDLEPWEGLPIVVRHPGIASDGFDLGWNVAAPVGHGGFPDDWFVGWRPLPAPPEAIP